MIFCCRVCKSNIDQIKFKNNIANFHLCKNCDALQVVPFPSEQELSKLYKDSWKALKSAETGGVSEKLASFYINKLNNIFDLNNLILLDFGAGQGRLCFEFKKRGFHFYAYEPFGNSVVDQQQSYIRSMHEIPTECDTVIMFDVIEHLSSPIEVITTLFDQLGPNVKIFISTPNPKSLNAILRGAKWREANKVGHIIFFTRKTSKIIASRLGCELIEVGPWGLANRNFVINAFYRLLEIVGLGGATRFILTNRKDI